MRRKTGIAGIKNNDDLRKKFLDKKREFNDLQIKELTLQIDKFKLLLTDFTHKHSHKFKDSEFRQHFSQICSKIGVDPLYSKNTVFSRLFGIFNSL
jgi:ESCRT-II complex subunit VPS22